ncbi:MAG TPA: AAA family ATPase [Chroococcidiopsis sp.]
MEEHPAATLRMSSEQPERFVNNWAYLKTELSWLERILMLAVARQRKDSKSTDRLTQNRADKATVHWWKDIVSLEGPVSYDEHRKPPVASHSYQQQLEARIQASRERGIGLALPLLCDRLQLSLFEKNLILMGLAPEVSRRYPRLYRFLEGDDIPQKTDLPTVDLALKLLCRNDAEWRDARQRLVPPTSPLLRHQLVQLVSSPADTLLNRIIKLSDPLINYLLAEDITPADLDALLYPPTYPPSIFPSLLHTTTPTTPWSQLILPAPLLTSLQALAQHLTVDSIAHPGANLGAIALLVGPPGTGKTLAAQAIAHHSQHPLTTVDLAQIAPADHERLLDELERTSPAIVLIKSAQHWLRRSSPLDAIALTRFLSQRRQQPSLTLLSVPLLPAVQVHWQRQVDAILHFPLPNAGDRLTLWQHAFPSDIALDPTIDWGQLAARLRLPGGTIQAIAHTAILHWRTVGSPSLSPDLLQQAIALHGIAATVPIQKPPAKPKRSRKK